MIRIGYACISLHDKDVYTGRTLTLDSIAKRGIGAAKDLALKNIADLSKIILYNESRGIRFFRLTSNLFPHMENPRAPPYELSFATDELAAAGKLIRELGHRVTMHPGQFVQLGSPTAAVVEQSIRDLTFHAKILIMMGLSPALGSVLIIHGGGRFGSKEDTLRRFAETFKKLPAETAQFISLENDEFSYSVQDLLPLCEELKIPLCIDYFHHEVFAKVEKYDLDALIPRVMRTWQLRGVKPKCHWSNQAPGLRRGSHADCVEDIPPRIVTMCLKYSCDIMIEAKNKDFCVLEIYAKFFNKVDNSGRVEWYLKNV